MIAKFINRGNILNSQSHPFVYHRQVFLFCTTPNYVDEYMKILIQLNLNTLKNQLIKMKNLPKKQSLGIKKTQIINQLCQLQPHLIELRVKHLRNKTIFQLQTQINIKMPLSYGQKQTFQQTSPVQKELTPNKATKHQSDTSNTKRQKLQNQALIQNSLKIVMPLHLQKLLKDESSTYNNIMDAFYGKHLKQNKQKYEESRKIQKLQFSKDTGENNQGQNESNKSFKDKQQQPVQRPSQTLTKLKSKPFVNLLFKTNQQVFIEQQKRKYLYENQKSELIDQLSNSDQRAISQEFIKNYWQIRAEKKDSPVMHGFYTDYSLKTMRKFLTEKNDRIVRMFTGFNYFKQLCSNPNLVKFIYAISFSKELPVEVTILKIAEESRQFPQVFKQNLLAISGEYFLKLLKISANYLLKVFKKTQNMEKKIFVDKKSSSQQDKYKDFDYEDDEFDDDDDHAEIKRLERAKRKAQKQQQLQNLPESRQFIDLELMRYAFTLFQAGIQRVVNEITVKKTLYFPESLKYSEMKANQQKQVKTVHETLMLCFDIYKAMESLFGSIEINDFNDLDRLVHILSKYNDMRKYLMKKIPDLEKFMRKYDPKYEEKIELGLSNIVTMKQIQKQNFVLKFQARKLNFDIIDNITSMLKHDNIEITLENKRDKILKILEEFFRVYVENDMLNFLEDELIYVMVRFLEKEVYMDKKVKGLFWNRVNFEQLTDKNNISHEVNRETFSEDSISLSSELEWFPTFQNPSNPLSNSTSSQQIFNSFGEQRLPKSYYYIGQLQQLLSKQLLFYLISIIKHKHEMKEIKIQPINGFNLIQEWYSQPSVVRLQFLKEEIIHRYKRLQQRDKWQKAKIKSKENQAMA